MHTWALFYYSAAKDLFLKPEFKAKATAALTRLAKLGHQFPEKKPRIFIVHGHDDAMKHEVARTLEKLDLDPIILHEQPNKGRTIIEKITDYSNVSFAIVLFSPDDVAHPVGAPEKVKKRARPNVVLELGYFLGRLGRERVIVLLKKDENFEIPSDFLGVLYIPFDKSWPLNLIKELKNRGLYIDANKLVD
ncbi:MAG: nucleotide-binding protein [Candidatus Helarchaeota archaeon]|nr:nucleotide-binding protein [Candidatus Helarchaeota archaeon]